jgi:hypothetical protein
MIRSVTTTILAAIVLAGTALGQTPDGSHAPPAAMPAPTGTASQPLTPAIAPDAPCSTGNDTSMWGSLSYMLGWTQGDKLPFLVTTSPPGTPRASAGVLPAATALFGGQVVNQQARSGIQGDLGYWFDNNHQAAIEGGFFLLSGVSTPFSASSNGSEILARPFINATTSLAASSLAAFPGVSSGSIRVSESSHEVWGFNLDIRENFFSGTYWRLDSLLGYRSFQFGERLLAQQSVQPIGGPFVPGTTITSTDSFATRNIFNGVDLGEHATFTYDAFSLDLIGKVAVGRVEHHLNISGNQVVTVPGTAPVTSEGGLLALSSNIGSRTFQGLTGVPEIGVVCRWQVSEYDNLRLGYSALWLLNVTRPGLAVDQLINPALIPPTTTTPTLTDRPAVNMNTTYLMVQGITLGVEFRY